MFAWCAMTSGNAREFGIALGKFVDLTVEQHRQVCQKAALDILNGVVDRSPVDSGRFRGAWLVSNKTPTDSAPEGVTGPGEALNAGTATIQAAQEFPIIYVQNNVVYAERLENGWSEHAPTGVLAVTVQSVADSLK